MGVQAGIDIGSAEVRRIVVETRWGGPRVLDPAARAATTVVGLPATALTFRGMAFPFHDRARLESLVRQELEHSLAFPLASSAWDFVAVPARPELEENVLAAACPSDRLKEVLARAGEKPTVVDGEPYAYQRILASAGIHDGLVVDFGARHTLFCRVRAGHLDYVRALMRGGDEITALLASARGGPTSAAEALKREKGLEQREVRSFYQGLVADALLPELPSGVPVFVAGGGAQTPGLLSWLQERLERPVQPVPLPEGLSPHRDAVAFGMALSGSRGAEGVNLVASIQGERQPVAVAALWIGLILLTITVGLGARAVAAARQVAAHEDAILAVVKRADPSISGPLPVNRLQAKVDELQGARGVGRPVLPLLMAVSESLQAAASGRPAASPAPDAGEPSPMPVTPSPLPSALPQGADSPISVRELVLTESELILQGEARSFGYVTSFKTALAERLQCQAQIPQQGQVGDRISFTVRLVLP